MTWSLYLTGPASAQRTAVITSAASRSLEFNLSTPSTCSFSMLGRDYETTLIEELITDTLWSRDGVDMLRCRIGSSRDSIDSDKHTVSFDGADYRSLLDRRYLTTSINTTAGASTGEQWDIAWAMVAQTQASSGGNLNITKHASWPTSGSGVTRHDLWDIGTQIGTAITDIGMRRSIAGLYGFDWDINPDLTMRMWTPVRGSITGFTIAWGVNCHSVTRSVSSTDYANFVQLQWTDPAGLAHLSSANSTDLATRQEGRWEYWEGGNWATTGEATTAAQGRLAYMQGLLPSYECEMIAGAWDPTSCWLGDTVNLVVKSGRLDVRPPEAVYRVQRIKIDLDDTGSEKVSITLGQPIYNLSSRLWLLGRDVGQLERR